MTMRCLLAKKTRAGRDISQSSIQYQSAVGIQRVRGEPSIIVCSVHDYSWLLRTVSIASAMIFVMFYAELFFNSFR